LGELYWNFGWAGVLAGMPLIGALLGLIAVRFDLTQGVNLTRVLVLIITIKLLILGFESVLNIQYSLWMRTMLVIGLLHLLLAHKRFVRRRKDTQPSQTGTLPLPAGSSGAPVSRIGPRYPNLMT